jgi:hypothetical protein
VIERGSICDGETDDSEIECKIDRFCCDIVQEMELRESAIKRMRTMKVLQ